MRSNPRSWVSFCGVKWPLCSFLITDITLCCSRSTTSDLPVAFHQHSAYILPLPNPQLKVELQVLRETNPIFYWCLEILPIPIPGWRACKHEKHNWDHHPLAHFCPFFIFPSRSPMTQTCSIILCFITYIPWLVSPHLPWRFFVGILSYKGSDVYHRQTLLPQSEKSMGAIYFFLGTNSTWNSTLTSWPSLKAFANRLWVKAWVRENEKALRKVRIAMLTSGCCSFNVYGLFWGANAINSMMISLLNCMHHV